MLRQKINVRKGISSWVDRAEERFEKESGWKSKDVRFTLENFSRLNRRHQFLLGGLLVSRAILGDAIPRPVQSKSSRKRRSPALDSAPSAV